MSKSKPSLRLDPEPGRPGPSVAGRTALVAAAHAPAVVLAAGGWWWWAITALLAAHAVLLAGTLLPRVRWFGPLVTRCLADGPGLPVWLTIDDGPCPKDTRAILDLLARHGARATFFLVGDQARHHPDLVAAIRQAGHGIANHTRSHPARSFWRLGPQALDREIGGGQSDLTAEDNLCPMLFRAPAGMHNPWVAPILRRHRLRLVGWSRRAFDTVRRDVPAMVDALTRGLSAGEILLVHQGTPHSVELLAAVLHRLGAQGARCVLPDGGGGEVRNEER